MYSNFKCCDCGKLKVCLWGIYLCLCFKWPYVSNVHQNKRDVAEGYGQVESRCECGDETSGSIKCGKFLDWLRNG